MRSKIVIKVNRGKHNNARRMNGIHEGKDSVQWSNNLCEADTSFALSWNYQEYSGVGKECQLLHVALRKYDAIIQTYTNVRSEKMKAQR